MIIVSLVGNLGADAEVKELNGRKYASLRVASTRRQQQNGQRVEVTTWVSVLASYNENLLPYLKKGQSVFVNGEATINTYQKRDGGTGVDVSMFADKLALAGSPKTDAQGANATQVNNYLPQQQNAQPTTFFGTNNDEPPF